MPLQDVLTALGARNLGLREAAGGWQSRCPAHDDRNPSLSIRQADDGKVLLKCHAGCEFQDVVAALGLEPSDLYSTKPDTRQKTPKKPPEPSKLPSGPEYRVYHYQTQEGGPAFAVARRDTGSGKTFSQWTPAPDSKGLWIPRALKAPRPLYRLPELLQSEGRVVVVEGEKCVEAAARLLPRLHVHHLVGRVEGAPPLGLDSARRVAR